MQRVIKRSRALLLMLVFVLAFAPLSTLANEGKTNTVNYVALGDSLAAGILSDNTPSTGYVGLIKNSLEGNGYEVNVHNAGKSGATSGQVLAGLSEISKLADADIITISVGANDILGGLMPILSSGINPADLNKEKLAEVQQLAEVTMANAKLAADAEDIAKSAVEREVNEIKNAMNNLEVTGAIEVIKTKIPAEKLPLVQPTLDNILSNVLTAQTSVGLALDTYNSAGSLETVSSELNTAGAKLNETVTIINSLKTFIPDDLKTLADEIVAQLSDASAKASTAKAAADGAITAVNVSNEAKVAAEQAQQAAQLLGDALTKLAAIPGIIGEVGSNTAQILGAIRSVNPTSKIYVMGYYNALPYLPAEVQEIMTKPMLFNLNTAISMPTSQFGATFVPVAQLFEGNYQTYLPNQANIHPSAAGYEALASAFIGAINPSFPKIEDPDPEEPYVKDVELGKELMVNSDELIRIIGADVTLLLPNDLPEGTLLTVTLTSEDALSKAEGLKAFGDALNFEFQYPEGFKDYEGTFTLMMGYDADSPEDVDIYYYNEAEGKWESQKGEKNKELQTISIVVTHFSNYGVFAQVDKPDDTPPVDPKDPVQDPDDGDDDKTPVPGAKDPGNGSKDDTKKDKKDDKTKHTKKGSLPNTATNDYNWLMLGISLLLTGVAMFLLSRKRRLSINA
ncbi:GDSL-type esterase/lipase family protein [Bacillus sp. FJAT-50079]|uniref:GDSL-type esterase/lipase family protein n=1 Tax=Bacillus sp. FJAT-50079 TaxID=2833577 RepID=UPI001BCA04F7|nr:GDSL-type esterase/lipase family protein [Bacillus sp. FJAT-50079]MBS4209186.1 LPXTG cell wall anchor domain-containing protein [Bacillus sp. FJAT-50079]